MTPPTLAGLRIGQVGPLPPPSGGMANQTQQLGELLTEAGAIVITVQVNAPYRPAWAGRVPVLRAVFRLLPYLLALCRAGATLSHLALLADATLWQQRAQAGLQQAQRYTWPRVQPVLAGVYRQAGGTQKSMDAGSSPA